MVGLEWHGCMCLTFSISKIKIVGQQDRWPGMSSSLRLSYLNLEYC